MNSLRRNFSCLAPLKAASAQIPIAVRNEATTMPPIRSCQTRLASDSPMASGAKPPDRGAAHAVAHGAAVASRQTRDRAGIELFRPASQFLSAITHPTFTGGVSGLTGLDRVNTYPRICGMWHKLRQLP